MSQKSHSPKGSKRFSRQRPLKVVVLGLPSVGKTALTVRFITRRFIGEYDPTLEKKYTFHTEVDGDPASFDILDTAGQTGGSDSPQLDEYLRWADAYIVVYCVTDRCSLEECTRLKFLISHAKRSRKSSSHVLLLANDLPIVLVANKNDLEHERMVSRQEGQLRSAALGCSAFHDISVRESYEEAAAVFQDLYRKVCQQGTVSRKSFRHVPCDESFDSSPPPQIALRKRDRGVVIGYSMSLDQFTVTCREKDKKDCSGSGGSSSFASRAEESVVFKQKEQKDPLRRKESVSKRFMRRVIPSLSSKEELLSMKSSFVGDSNES